MNDYQIVEVKMMQEIVDFFDQNSDLEKNNPKLKEHVDQLRKILKNIAENAKDQSFDNTGYTENKKKVKSNLATLIVNITSSICSFATDSGKNELYNQFKIPISKVNAKGDAKIVTYSNTIIQEAGKYSKELKPYNVTAEELTELSNLTKEYSAILLIPAQKRNDIAIATANIKKLIPQGLKILKRSIDRDMNHYKDINVKAYDKYHRLRNIDDSQTDHKAFYGYITSKKTGKPLQYAAVTVIRFRGARDLATKVKSTKTGLFQMPDLEPNKYNGTVELDGYVKYKFDFTLNKGQSIKLDIELDEIEEE